VNPELATRRYLQQLPGPYLALPGAIEAIGNVNYPKAASEQGIYETRRVMVARNPDGSVNDIHILRSSGERVLDEAAVDIVRLAAPCDPFPPALRARQKCPHRHMICL
jgi:TonB family protein